MDQATDSLARWRDNIHLISQLIQNDVSSTKVRLFLRRGMSVRYLLPADVVDYIEEFGLYQEEGAGGGSGNDKGKEKENSESSGMAKGASQSSC
jgi:nicotinamide mononucleotide adenylyltransferase